MSATRRATSTPRKPTWLDTTLKIEKELQRLSDSVLSGCSGSEDPYNSDCEISDIPEEDIIELDVTLEILVDEAEESEPRHGPSSADSRLPRAKVTSC